MSISELEMLIGELCRSINHEEIGSDEEAVLDLCDRLEYAEKTGDGAHPGILWLATCSSRNAHLDRDYLKCLGMKRHRDQLECRSQPNRYTDHLCI